MCGIAGYWNFRCGRPAEADVLEAMTGTLTHRGPDEDGFFLEGAVGLGNRRLQVVDPAGGHQPMVNEDGTVQVVYNGEIYNHAELREELERSGHRFRTRSDTEVIAHAYEEWGLRCVERFNGMFAFALWEGPRHRLLLARDRLGIKPLYYHLGPEGVTFGSELKAVVAAPWVPLAWDMEAVDDFLTYEFVPAPRSIVVGVAKLPAASWLLIEADRPDAVIAPHRYWNLEAGRHPVPGDPEEAAAGLRDRLGTAVRRRLMADVPLGAFLSGGIDSSIIVGSMSRESAVAPLTFSLGFDDRSYDELHHARIVATHFRTRHREARVTPDVVAMADDLAGFYDEPFADVSAFPTWLISTLARQDVTVALSGDGGDELFAGYDHYLAHRWAHKLRRVARTRGWSVVQRLLDRVPPTAAKKGTINTAKRFVEGARRPDDLEHARWLVFWDLAERRALYSTDALRAVGERDCFGYYRSLLREGADHGFSGLQRQLYADIRGYLADDILTKVDRASMATSLEVRVPFLDHEVVEYAMAIPAAWKIRRGRTKWVLRHAFADLLPPVITGRDKQGFSIPLKNWLRGPLQPMLRDLLDPGRVRDRGWFEPAEVRRLVDEHTRGSHNHAHRLWCLMALELSLTNLHAAAARVLHQ